jgi:zinc transport system permease protein
MSIMIEWLDDFLVRALVAGVGLAVVAGPVGCLVVWRRMAYFGATLAHAALLGLALGLLLDTAPMAAVVVVCVALSAALVGLERRKTLATDTLLGILAHGSLALGLVVLAFMETVRVDLMAYLFGDILSVTWSDIVWIYIGGAAALAALAYLWRDLLSITIHEDLARVDGVAVEQRRFLFMVLIAVVVAVAMKIVGILLTVSMLIVPAAAARPLSASPERMAVLAAVLGAISVLGGLAASLAWDTPAGPSIVVAATVLFLLTFLGRLRTQAG